jgi:hypothetical protein
VGSISKNPTFDLLYIEQFVYNIASMDTFRRPYGSDMGIREASEKHQRSIREASENMIDRRPTASISGKEIMRLTGIWNDHVCTIIRKFDETGRIPDVLKKSPYRKVTPSIASAIAAAALANRGKSADGLARTESPMGQSAKFPDGLSIRMIPISVDNCFSSP